MNEKIGCDAKGNCTATSKAECWRYSRDKEQYRTVCEYLVINQCTNVHALEEAKENERQD